MEEQPLYDDATSDALQPPDGIYDDIVGSEPSPEKESPAKKGNTLKIVSLSGE